MKRGREGEEEEEERGHTQGLIYLPAITNKTDVSFLIL